MNKLIILAITALFSFTASAQENKPSVEMVQFVLSPNRPSWTYEPFESATIRISVYYQGNLIPEAEVSYEFGPEMLPPEKQNSIILKDGTGILNIGMLTAPGFKQLKVSTEFDGYTYSDIIKVAYKPQKIKATVKFPEDFKTFWDKAMQENKSIAMDDEVKLLPEYSNDSINVYLVKYQNGEIDSYIYGFMCKPKKAGKHPALLIAPSEECDVRKPETTYAEAGFISLQIGIHGLNPQKAEKEFKQEKNEIGDYFLKNISDPNSYYYKKVYLACLRGIDFLAKQTEFDGTNLGAAGKSQGGGLAIMTAALHPKVSFVSAFYPALCDQTASLKGRAGGWPHIFSTKQASQSISANGASTISYYDVVNFARILNKPGFYSLGFNDQVCSPSSMFSAINNIKSEKEVLVNPIAGHWHFDESQEKALRWMQEKCGTQEQ